MEDKDSIWMSEGDIAKLTGRKRKSLQIAYLRTSGIPFTISSSGHPVVAKSVAPGVGFEPPKTKQKWQPNVR